MDHGTIRENSVPHGVFLSEIQENIEAVGNFVSIIIREKQKEEGFYISGGMAPLDRPQAVI